LQPEKLTVSMTVLFADTVTHNGVEIPSMALTDTRIRSAKPHAKTYKLSDGGGMYLLVKPDGGRYWRLDYRFVGKRCTLALGVYPALSLSNARTRREEARRLLAQNI
jgi:hypothetical protein